MPKVSVIIPAYQAGRFIKETIDSVIHQTYEDYEIIVIDDGSTDNTLQILKEYGTRIKVIRQKNMGVSTARNKGIVNSRGEYIAFLDSDDLWLPHKLELQTRFLDDNPHVGLVFSNLKIIRNGRDTNTTLFELRKPSSGRVSVSLLINNFIGTSTVMVRKTCFEKAGLFDESFILSEDHDMWSRFAKFFEVAYIDAPLVIARIHGKNIGRNEQQLQIFNIILKKKILAENPHLLSTLNLKTLNKAYYQLYSRLGMIYLRDGKTKKARKNFKEYVRLYPYRLNIYFFFLLTFIPSPLLLGFQKFLSNTLTRKPFLSLKYSIYGRLFSYDPLWCKISDRRRASN